MPAAAPSPRFTLGLTGGIGSGKSTVADMFASLGATLIDTDVIAHQLTAPQGAAIPTIRTQFGAEFITPTGALDRARMRALVFADPAAKARLEAILHPLIRSETEAQPRAAKGDDIIFVVPLLVESGNWKQRVSRVLVVDCPEAQQIQRVMARSGLSEDQVKAIMGTQASREQRLAAADDVALNDGDLPQLASRVQALHAIYLGMAQI
jgi:dephospho-CoA kinase